MFHMNHLQQIIHIKSQALLGLRSKQSLSDQTELSSRVGIFVTVVPTESDSDVIFCLQLISKTLTCTLQLS